MTACGISIRDTGASNADATTTDVADVISGGMVVDAAGSASQFVLCAVGVADAITVAATSVDASGSGT